MTDISKPLKAHQLLDEILGEEAVVQLSDSVYNNIQIAMETYLEQSMKQINLTDAEKSILGLSLFGFAMRAGPGIFEKVTAVAEKLGVTKELMHYAADWLAAPKSSDKPIIKKDAESTVLFAIFHGIVTQWHRKDEEHFVLIVMNNIFKELFTFHKDAVKEMLKDEAAV